MFSCSVGVSTLSSLGSESSSTESLNIYFMTKNDFKILGYKQKERAWITIVDFQKQKRFPNERESRIDEWERRVNTSSFNIVLTLVISLAFNVVIDVYE